MKHPKLHTIQIKKDEYKKHLQRLSHIYKDDKEKKKILKESRSIDKLMAATHRLRQTTNQIRLKHKFEDQNLSVQRDWNKVNCSLLSTSKKPFEISSSMKNQKFKHQQKSIQKQNKDIFFRLIKVKPTIQTNKMQYLLNKTTRMPFLARTNKTQMDFSSILNSSIIRPEQTKRIIIRLHSHNEELVKIRLEDEVRQIFNQDKIYFLQIKNQDGKFVDSLCFSLKELLESEICIFKKKDQIIDIIYVKELILDSKTIEKGCFYIEQNQGVNENENKNSIFFIYPNKKIIVLRAKINKKNIKIKGKRGILPHRDTTLGLNNQNLPQINHIKET